MYDFEKLSWRIDEKRKKFKICIVIYILLFVAGVVMFFAGDDNVAFLGIIVDLVSIFLFANVWRTYSPTVLFSEEIKGVNIKEHEYVQSVKNGLSMRKNFALRGAKTYSNSGNAKSRRPHVRAAYVYVRMEDGDVAVLDGLTSLHTDIYEIGDELFRPAGARYPVIISRNAEKQPCPFCGRINDMDSLECQSCGLSILQKRK